MYRYVKCKLSKWTFHVIECLVKLSKMMCTFSFRWHANYHINILARYYAIWLFVCTFPCERNSLNRTFFSFVFANIITMECPLMMFQTSIFQFSVHFISHIRLRCTIGFLCFFLISSSHILIQNNCLIVTWCD